MEFVSPEGLRLDGRRPKELRKLRIKLGSLDGTDGSAFVQLGNTKVLAAVFGPRGAPTGARSSAISCVIAVSAISVQGDRRSKERLGRQATEFSRALTNAMEQLVPADILKNACIDVHVQVLQADGGLFAACANAALLALANAGVPLRDICAACHTGLLESTALVDLSAQESMQQAPQAAILYECRTQSIAIMQTDNKMSTTALEELLELATEGCIALVTAMRQALISSTVQQLSTSAPHASAAQRRD
ncbi:hypothetical protein WJX72_006955 [[Myrmecia] bisecta]|uniref:Exosome complex component RRP41 n=1 Tax=[Myrmecia] bisecta TaxID=41462 RepID=A0AAW1R8A9_9CHLO